MRKWIGPRVMTAGLSLVMVVVALWLGSCSASKDYQRPMADLRLRAAMPGTGSAIGRGQEELWIVPVGGMRNLNGGGAGGSVAAEADMAAGRGSGMAVPGSPVLAAQQWDGGFAEMPLKRTEVKATISGCIASVGVRQEFANTSAQTMEAVYVFPLPADAGVSDFVMKIGERHIRGIVRERAEAAAIYEAARAQGYVASLLAEDRPNVFTQRVARIAPGQAIDVEIQYFHTLTYVDGWLEWVYPMVVGRPGGDVPAGRLGAAPQRSGRDISLHVDVDAGMVIEQIDSVNHKIGLSGGLGGGVDPRKSIVDLVPAEAIANKDFVLRFKVAGEKVKTGLVVQKDADGKGGWFSLMVVPLAEGRGLARRAVDAVFVMDTSAAMDGGTLVRARNALSAALMRLKPEDTFLIVPCGGDNPVFSAVPMAATGENLARAQQYVSGLRAGGTGSLLGVREALGRAQAPMRGRVVALFSSGNTESDLAVARALQDRLTDASVISFGPRSPASRGLLEALAREGRDQAAYMPLEDLVGTDLDACFERVSHPALTWMTVGFGGLRVSDVYTLGMPEVFTGRSMVTGQAVGDAGAAVTSTESGGWKLDEVNAQVMPELFVGRPVMVTGRYTGAATGEVTVTGSINNGKPITWTMAVADGVQMNPAVRLVWARAKLTDLHDQALLLERDVRRETTATALTYGLATELTSFVAVDATKSDGGGAEVTVPVSEGVEYEVVRGRRE